MLTKLERMQQAQQILRNAQIALGKAITSTFIGSPQAKIYYNEHLDLMADWMLLATKEGVESETILSASLKLADAEA